MEAQAVCSGPWLPPPAFESMGAGVHPSMAGGGYGRSGWLGMAAASWAPASPPRHRPARRGRAQGWVRAWFPSRTAGVSQRGWVELCTPIPVTLLSLGGEDAEDSGAAGCCACVRQPACSSPGAPGLCSRQLPSASLGCEPTAAPCLASHVTKTCLTHLFVMLPGLIPAVDPEPLLETPPASPEQEAWLPPAARLATWPPVTLVLSSTSSSQPCPGLWDSSVLRVREAGWGPWPVRWGSPVRPGFSGSGREATPILSRLCGGHPFLWTLNPATQTLF